MRLLCFNYLKSHKFKKTINNYCLIRKTQWSIISWFKIWKKNENLKLTAFLIVLDTRFSVARSSWSTWQSTRICKKLSNQFKSPKLITITEKTEIYYRRNELTKISWCRVSSRDLLASGDESFAGARSEFELDLEMRILFLPNPLVNLTNPNPNPSHSRFDLISNPPLKNAITEFQKLMDHKQNPREDLREITEVRNKRLCESFSERENLRLKIW